MSGASTPRASTPLEPIGRVSTPLNPLQHVPQQSDFKPFRPKSSSSSGLGGAVDDAFSDRFKAMLQIAKNQRVSKIKITSIFEVYEKYKEQVKRLIVLTFTEDKVNGGFIVSTVSIVNALDAVDAKSKAAFKKMYKELKPSVDYEKLDYGKLYGFIAMLVGGQSKTITATAVINGKIIRIEPRNDDAIVIDTQNHCVAYFGQHGYFYHIDCNGKTPEYLTHD